jgi:hypothetical protein
MSGNFTFAQGLFARPPRARAAQSPISGNSLDAVPEIPGDLAMRRRKTVGRPSRVTDVAPRIIAWLRTEPALTGVEVFRRVRELGYGGGKTAVYDFVQRVRRSDAISRRGPAPAPGLYAMLEFTTADVRFATEGRKRILVLAAELEWSRFVHVAVGFQFTPAARLRCVLDACAAFGGVPVLLGWTSTRLVAHLDPAGAISWEPALAHFALQVGCALRLHGGRGTPASRRAGRRIKDTVFAARTFHDRADLDARLRKWLGEVNRARDPRNGPPAVERLREESSRLLPFPEARRREFTES